MPKIYVTRKIPKPGVDLLTGQEVSTWNSDDAIPKPDLLKHVKGVDGLLCMLTDPIDKSVIEAAGPQLKIISTMSVGYEHIDVAECLKRGIKVTNTPGVSTDSVAELTVGLLLCVTRRLFEGVDAVRKNQWGLWKPMWLLGHELHNSCVGILGFGRIGFGVGKRLKAFGVKTILYHDVVEMSHGAEIEAKFSNFEEICKRADFICVCCNLTPETRNMLNKESFEKMKKHVVVVNTGRGGVINHDDLYDALKSGRIRGAGLDVTEPEPLPHNHKLTTLNNCVITPHMGSNTWESRNEMAKIAASNVIACLTGKGKLHGEVTTA